MSRLAVDTSALLAVFKGEADGAAWLECLRSAAEVATLVISSVALAEVRAFFPSDNACRRKLREMSLRHDPPSEKCALLAGEIFRRYRNEGGPRKIILPDFLVAAHAAVEADALATADRGYLRAYFPRIRQVTPAAPF